MTSKLEIFEIHQKIPTKHPLRFNLTRQIEGYTDKVSEIIH